MQTDLSTITSLFFEVLSITIFLKPIQIRRFMRFPAILFLQPFEDIQAKDFSLEIGSDEFPLVHGFV